MAKKTQSDKILEQTNSKFNLVGIISGLDKDGAYTERTIENGKNQGKEVRNLRFNVRTSKHQFVSVEMSGFEKDDVYLYNFKEKETKKVSLDDWVDNKDDYEEKGFHALDSQVITSTDKKDTGVRDIDYFNAELIHDEFKDGDQVFISGDIKRGSYEKDGKVIQTTRYQITKIQKQEDTLDFDAPDFKEYAVFKEQFVFDEVEDGEDEKSIIIHGKAIDYAQKTFPVRIDLSWDSEAVMEHPNASSMDEEEKAKEKKVIKEIVEINKATAEAFKEINFGTLLTIQGRIIRKAIVEEAEEEDVNPLLARLQGRATKNITRYENKMLFVGTKEVVEDKYTEEDFQNALDQINLVEEEKEDKPKKNSLSGRSMAMEVDDDDLPF